MSTKPCCIPGCGEPKYARRFCRRHYELQRTGRSLSTPRYATKLTAAQIEEIRNFKPPEESLSDLAKRMGVSRQYVSLIRSGKRSPGQS